MFFCLTFPENKFNSIQINAVGCARSPGARHGGPYEHRDRSPSLDDQELRPDLRAPERRRGGGGDARAAASDEGNLLQVRDDQRPAALAHLKLAHEHDPTGHEPIGH